MIEVTKSSCFNAKTFFVQNKSTNHLFLLKQMIGLSLDSMNINIIDQPNIFDQFPVTVLDKFKNCFKSSCFLKAKSNLLTSSSIKSNNCNLNCTKNCLPCLNCFQCINYTSPQNSDYLIHKNISQLNDYNDNLSSASRSSAIYINNICNLNKQCSDYKISNQSNNLKTKRNQKLKNDFKTCKDATTNKQNRIFEFFKLGLMKAFLFFSLFATILSKFNTKNHKLQQIIIPLLLILCTVFNLSDACSARSTPKPRPPLPEIRPNITFQTYQCPEAYANWYCLNGATCFFVRIGESILYNCECADGYMGQRCEFKDLEGSYMQSREKVLVETAKIAGGALSVIVVFIFVGLVFYINYINKRKSQTRLENHLNQSPFIT